jgi:hypothetical protein
MMFRGQVIKSFFLSEFVIALCVWSKIQHSLSRTEFAPNTKNVHSTLN